MAYSFPPLNRAQCSTPQPSSVKSSRKDGQTNEQKQTADNGQNITFSQYPPFINKSNAHLTKVWVSKHLIYESCKQDTL